MTKRRFDSASAPVSDFANFAFLLGETARVWNPRRTLLKSPRLGGRLAQLGERIVRNDEAGGSNPLPSTKQISNLDCLSELDELPKLPN